MPRFSDKQFFNWEIQHGLYPSGHNKGFYDVHKKLADFILKHKPNNHLDLGGGNSPLCKILQDNGVTSSLIELNPYSVKLQNEYGTKNVYELDFCANGLTGKYDVITSIEVFEHIEDSKLLPFIADLANHCEYFIFSSTPKKNHAFDEEWGHVNIKSRFEWVEIFEKNGFKCMFNESDYLQANCIPTTWALMFKSLKHA